MTSPPAGRARPLRICYILEASFAGAGRYSLDLWRAMAERGHEAHLIYSPRRADAHFLAEIQDCRQAAVLDIPMRRMPHPSDLLAALRIIRYLAQHGPFDIVHGVSSKGGAMARLAGAAGPAAVCYTPQALVTMSPSLRRGSRALFGAIERRLAPLTAAIIVVSDVERRHGCALGIPEDKLLLIPNGMAALPPADRDGLRAALGIAPATVVVGFIGRLEEQKAPDLLVRTAALLSKDLPDWQFLLVGAGGQEQALRRMAQRLGVGDRLRWLGEVRGRDYIGAFDLLLVTSGYEGFPYVFLEALQSGLPVVTTPVGGATEAVDHMGNGIIVRQGDEAALAASLTRLITDPPLRARMSAASRQRAARFDLESMVDQVEAVYWRSLASRRRSGGLDWAATGTEPGMEQALRAPVAGAAIHPDGGGLA